jgi:hypothetical protein
MTELELAGKAQPSAPLGRFLPLAKMAEIAESERETYANAKPFPHIVMDNFFDPALLEGVLEEFPKSGEFRWAKFDDERQIKLASSSESAFGPTTRLLLYHLNSITFLDFLSKLTGIENLMSDPCFDGGGLHQIVRGESSEFMRTSTSIHATAWTSGST